MEGWMDSPFSFITCILLFLILTLMFLEYRNAMRKVEGFPFSDIVLKIAYDQVTGKIPKDVPFNSYIFHTIMNICKQFTKEGLLMTYMSRPVLFIFSEEAIKFFSNEKAAMDKSPEYEIVEEAMGAGIDTSNGERWRTHRKMINPAFHIGMLKNKVSLFNEHALALVKDMEKLAGKPSVDILDALKSNYFNALSESVFGLKQSEENKAQNLKMSSKVDRMCAMIVQRILYPWLHPKILLNFTPFGRKFQRMNRECKNFVTKVINDMRKTIDSDKVMDADRFSNHLRKSFAYILLSQYLKDPSFTFQDLHDEVSTILVAGYDTTTYTTMWCLFMIALHPEVQEKIFNEIQSTTGSYITYEESCNLTYLEAAIMETLRLYSTVPIYSRNLTADVQFGKYKVHKGTTVAFVPYMAHRNPDIYPNPEMFDPERFLSGESKRTAAFIPFSEGSRSCIGKRYAIIEMKIFLAHVLRNFEITSLDRREDIGLCWTLILTPAKHIRMKLTPRIGGQKTIAIMKGT